MWITGQVRGRGAGVGSPEGCFTITVRRHGARMYSMCVSERSFSETECGLGERGRYEGGGAEEWLFGFRPQNMVVSYLVLTGRLLESRWSKSQVVLPRECISASISRGSICRSLGLGEVGGEGGRRDERRA